MNRSSTWRAMLTAAALLLSSSVALAACDARAAASQAVIARDSQDVLRGLYAANPKAEELGKRAFAVLVFPRIVKAGLLVGGQAGDGALIEGGQVVGYYNIAAGSLGFQAGAQTFSYALFFITQSALDYLKKSDGWSIGTGPSVVIVDQGFAKSMTSTTLTQDVYAMPFGQRGLMAGTGLEGSKITEIHPGP